MNKLVISLMALVMLCVVGCASSGRTSSAPVASGTPIDLGDSSPLAEVDAYDDEAVEDLPDMVAAEM